MPLDLAQHARGLARHAHCAQAEARADRGDQLPHQRMKMEMLVRITVIECQTAVAESRKLRGDFRGELPAHGSAEGDARPEGRKVGTKKAGVVHQVSHGRGW